MAKVFLIFQVVFGIVSVIALLAFIIGFSNLFCTNCKAVPKVPYTIWYLFCMLACCAGLFAAIRGNFIWTMITFLVILLLAFLDVKHASPAYVFGMHIILILTAFAFLIVLCVYGKVSTNWY